MVLYDRAEYKNKELQVLRQFCELRYSSENGQIESTDENDRDRMGIARRGES